MYHITYIILGDIVVYYWTDFRGTVQRGTLTLREYVDLQAERITARREADLYMEAVYGD